MPGLANDLNISEPGYVTHNGSGVFHGRTFQQGTGIVITNPDGISGNTTISCTVTGGITEIDATTGTTTGPIVTIQGQDGLSTSISGTTLTATPRGVGTGNMFLGEAAGNLTTTGNFNDSYGSNSLNAITSGSTNFAAGGYALNKLTTGDNNIAIGTFAMQNAISSSNNVAIGYNCMTTNAPGNTNSCIGYYCGSEITGNSNCFFGSGVAQGSAGGDGNAAIGNSALHVVSGNLNTACGNGSLANLTSGANNLALGANSAFYYTSSESNNITLNHQGVIGETGESNTLRIGEATGTGTRELNASYICGIFGKTTAGSGVAVYVDANNQLGTVVSSRRYKENIKQINNESSFIFDLNPVSFNYIKDNEKKIQYGLIAEEVEEINPYLVVRDAKGEIHSVKYQELPVLMLNEMKKLRDEILYLKKEIQDLKH